MNYSFKRSIIENSDKFFGTIGGLVMSVIGVFIWLPILALRRKEIMSDF